MKILGMGRGDIKNLFMFEALILGVMGGIIGIIWGMILGKIANTIFNGFAIRAGGDTVSIFYYPWGLMLGIVLIAILVGFVTGIYPARRAARVNALNVLRFE